jgi:5'-nucleotidase/UDP-sugar diphosphatase
VKRLALMGAAAVALLIVACQNQDQNQKPQARPEAPAKPLDQMDTGTPAPGDVYPAEPAPPIAAPSDTPGAAKSPAAGAKPSGGAKPSAGAKSPQATAKPSKPDEPLAPSGGKTYVTQKGDTLSKIAQKFYKDASKWKKIWEANKARIPNPDKLPVGTKLIIP